MGFDPLSAILDVGKTVLDKFVADKMSEKEREELKNNYELAMRREALEGNKAFREFILAYEGSAETYRDVWFFGPLLIFIRGCIRPAFTVGAMYWDWQLFSSSEVWDGMRMKLLLIINVLVLIFWFGERSVKYILPLVKSLFLEKGSGRDLS